VKRLAFLTLIAAAVFFFTVSPAEANSVPDEAYISGVVGHAQTLSLSCESRSASDWAAFWGLSISELDFLDRLPRSDNPNEGFVGNPNDDWGYTPPYSYGVHADPVAKGLRDAGLDAHAGSGLSWEEIRAEVAEGRPVIVWVIGSVYSGEHKIYSSQDGQDVRVAAFEHTMILIGYDKDSVHLVDAFTGLTVTHSLENFLESWSVLNNMAVVGKGSTNEKVDSNGLQKEDEHTYTVRSGDTLAKIATTWGISWQQLAVDNQISFPYFLPVGQEITIATEIAESETNPAPLIDSSAKTHQVASGEHLMSIARDWDVDWELLASVNELEAPYLLLPGDELIIPGSESVASAESEKDAPPASLILISPESLYSLAHRYDLDWLALAAQNNLSFPYFLQSGQEILLIQ